MSLSHGLLGALIAVTLLLSVPVVGAGIYFRMRAVTECERVLQLTVIVLGCPLLLFSLAPDLWAYVVAMFLLIVVTWICIHTISVL